MKKFILLFIIMLSSATSCQSDPPVSQAPPQKPANMLTLSGDFRNLTGVMHPLSCHCGYSGILNSKSGVFSVCLKTELPHTCNRLRVTGEFKRSDVKANGSCSDSSNMILFADTAECY